jgi:hypothetical protein
MLLNINGPIAPPDDGSKKLEAYGRQFAPNYYRIVAILRTNSAKEKEVGAD